MKLTRPKLDFDYDIEGRNSNAYNQIRSQMREKGVQFEDIQSLHMGSGEFTLDTPAIKLTQQIGDKSHHSYIFSGYGGALYAASEKNLTSVRPIMNYASLENGKVNIQNPVQRVLGLVTNPTATNHSGKTTSLTKMLQDQGADSIPIGKLTHQGNLENVFANGFQLGGPKNTHQQVVDMLNSQPGYRNDPLLRYAGVGVAVPTSAYAKITPGGEYTNDQGNQVAGLFMSKAKRNRLYKGDIGGALLRDGDDFTPGTEPFYAGNQNVPGRSYGITAAFDVFSNLPEGQGLTRDVFAYRQFARPVNMPKGSSYDSENGITLPNGQTLGAGSYFGQRIGNATKGMNRLGGLRDFNDMFNKSLGNVRTGIINEVEPEFDPQGNWTGRAKLGVQRVTDALTFKQGGTKLSLLHTNQDLGADMLARFPEQSELPAFALQVLKGEKPTSGDFNEWFTETAINKGYSPDWVRANLNSGKVSTKAMPMVVEGAIDRVLSRLQYVQKQDVELTPMQYEAMRGKTFTTYENTTTPIGNIEDPMSPAAQSLGFLARQDSKGGYKVRTLDPTYSPSDVQHRRDDISRVQSSIDTDVSVGYTGPGYQGRLKDLQNAQSALTGMYTAGRPATSEELSKINSIGTSTRTAKTYNVFDDTPSNVTQLANGNYQVSKFNDLRGTYGMAANFRPEFSKDSMQLGPYALNLMSQYNPELFKAVTSIGKSNQVNNTAYNTVASYRANYEPEQYEALKKTFGIANVDMDKVKTIQQQLISEDPNRSGGDLMEQTMRGMKDLYGKQSLQFDTPQGSVISPSANALLSGMTSGDDGQMLPSWATRMGSLITQTAMGASQGELSEMTAQAFSGIPGKGGNYGGLEQYANQAGVVKQAESLTLPRFGGAAYGAEGVGVNELVASRSYVAKMTGINDTKQLYNMADSGQLAASILRYPASNPREMTVNQRIKFYEDMPEKFQNQYQSPGKNFYMSPDAMASIHGDFDFDRVVGMVNRKALGTTGRFLGGALKVLPQSQILQTAKNKVESEYTKQLDIFNDRNKFDIDQIREHFSNPANQMGVPLSKFSKEFSGEEQGSKGKVGIIHNALLRSYGQAANTTSEGIFGTNNPVMDAQRKALGIMSTYGQQKLLDIKQGSQDNDLQQLVNIAQGGWRSTGKGGQPSYGISLPGEDNQILPGGDEAFFQSRFENFLNIGKPMGDEEYNRVGLPESIATQLINRSELKNLYDKGGEGAVNSRIGQVSDLIRGRRGSAPDTASSQAILSLTGASSFSEWGTGAEGGDLSSLSTGAQWITGSVAAKHFNHITSEWGFDSKTGKKGPVGNITRREQFPAGGQWANAGQATMAATEFTPAIEDASQGIEGVVASTSGTKGIRSWISQNFPGMGAGKASFLDRISSVQSPTTMANQEQMYDSLISKRESLRAAGHAYDSPAVRAIEDEMDTLSTKMFSGGAGQFIPVAGHPSASASSASGAGVFIPVGGGSSSSGNIPGGGSPPIEPPDGAFAAAFSDDGSGGNSVGSSGFGGGTITNNIMKTAMPKLSTKQISEAVVAMDNLQEAAKNLVSPLKEVREEYVKHYDSLKDIVSYGVRADQYSGIGKGEAYAQSKDPGYQAYQKYFGAQAGTLQQFVSQNAGAAIDASVQNYRESLGGGQPEAPQGLGSRIAGMAESAGERLIKGQGLFHAKLALNMLVGPAISSARDYLNDQASQGAMLYQTGQLGFSDLMSDGYGSATRRQALEAQGQLAYGRQVYNAYSPIVNGAIGPDSANGPLGALAAIGGPALGVGIATTSVTGNVMAGAGAALATAGFGAAGYIDSATKDRYSMGEIQNGQKNITNDFSGVVGNGAQALTDRIGNALLGNGYKFIQNARGTSINGATDASQGAGDYASFVDQYAAGRISKSRFLSAMKANDWNGAEGVNQAVSNIKTNMGKFGLSPDQAQAALASWSTFNSTLQPNDQQQQGLAQNQLGGFDASTVFGLLQSSGIAPGSDRAGSIFQLASNFANTQPNQMTYSQTLRGLIQNTGNISQLQLQAAYTNKGVGPLIDYNALQNQASGINSGAINATVQNSQNDLAGTAAATQLSNPAYYNAVGKYALQANGSAAYAYNQGNFTAGNIISQQASQNGSLFNQMLNYGMSAQQATDFTKKLNNVTDPRQAQMYQAILSGDRMQQSVLAEHTGQSQYRTLNTQTGMDIFAQSVPQQMVDYARGNDKYNMFAGVTDSELQNGNLGMSREMTIKQRNLETMQYGMQIQSRDIGYNLQTGNLGAVSKLYGQAGMGFNSGNGMGYNQLDDANRVLNRSQQSFSYQQDTASLGIQQSQFALAGQQFNANYGLQTRQFQYNTNYQRTQMGIDQSHTVQQEGWQTQDLAFSRSQLDVHFGWQMQDSDREIRYARGMDKRNLMRQKAREVIDYSMQASHSDVEQQRNQTQIQWEQQNFDRQKQYFEQGVKFQQESLDNQKKFFDAGHELDSQRLQLQQQAHQKQLLWMQEGWKLEDQRVSLDRQNYQYQYNQQVQLDTAGRQTTIDVQHLTDAMGGFNQTIQQMLAYAQTIQGQTGSINGSSSSSSGPYTGPGLPAVTGTNVQGMHQGYKNGGYTGDGPSNQIAGVTHYGEVVIPVNGMAVVRGSDSETSKKHDRMIQLLEKISNNPAMFQVVMDGQKQGVTPLYQQGKARL